MNKIELARGAVSIATGLGISQIITGVVASTTPTDTTYQKVTVTTAKIALGMLIGEALDNMLDRKQADLISWWNENITTKAESK